MRARKSAICSRPEAPLPPGGASNARRRSKRAKKKYGRTLLHGDSGQEDGRDPELASDRVEVAEEGSASAVDRVFHRHGGIQADDLEIAELEVGRVLK